MKRWPASALVVVCLAAPAAACELVLREQRGGHELWRGALDANAPQLTLSFTHSVLGTPVQDHYRWLQGRWVLTQERFEGHGYGLPHRAGPGERLERDGEGWRLQLQREVHPLVVRPVQQMRLLRPGDEPLLLASLSRHGIELQARACRQGTAGDRPKSPP